jgi:hypothetical protein
VPSKLTEDQTRERRERDARYYRLNKERIKQRSLEYRASHKADLVEYHAQYYSKNKEAISKRAAAYFNDNVIHLEEKRKEWFKKNASKVREYKREYFHSKMRTDEKFALNQRMSSLMRDLLKKKGQKGASKWTVLVGYSLEALKCHLEKNFKPGMSWENKGRWHIDHEIPISAFHFSAPDDLDFKRCWALSNLQPLWKTDNLKKSNKLSAPFQPALQLRGIA